MEEISTQMSTAADAEKGETMTWRQYLIKLLKCFRDEKRTKRKKHFTAVVTFVLSSCWVFSSVHIERKMREKSSLTAINRRLTYFFFINFMETWRILRDAAKTLITLRQWKGETEHTDLRFMNNLRQFIKSFLFLRLLLLRSFFFSCAFITSSLRKNFATGVVKLLLFVTYSKLKTEACSMWSSSRWVWLAVMESTSDVSELNKVSTEPTMFEAIKHLFNIQQSFKRHCSVKSFKHHFKRNFLFGL